MYTLKNPLTPREWPQRVTEAAGDMTAGRRSGSRRDGAGLRTGRLKTSAREALERRITGGTMLSPGGDLVQGRAHPLGGEETS